MGKRKENPPRAFESMGGKTFINPRGKNQTDTFARVYTSMLLSPAYQSLNFRQRHLYTCMKDQFFGKRKPCKDYEKQGLYQDNKDEYFYFNWQLALDYGLYTPKSNSNFYKDVDVLIQHGFIEKVKSGQGHKTKNVYRYSDQWKKWK